MESLPMKTRAGIKRILLGFCWTLIPVGFLCANEKTLAEDPFALVRQAPEATDAQAWLNRSPDDLRKWAKENLHHKLIGREVIDASKHPEWNWFRESGLGLFLHWGLASVPPNNGDAWAMVWNAHRAKHDLLRKPEAMFKVAETWNPKNYNPHQWMAAASKAGFGYAVLTTRHHDGYCLWPSDYGEWDTGEYMNGRDLVKTYVEACRRYGVRVGFYYSGPNWHFNYQKKDFSWPPQGYNYRHEQVDADPPLAALMGYDPPLPGEGDALERKESAAQVQELMTRYGPIDLMWWDGNSIMSLEELTRLQPNIFVARGMIATPEGRHHGKSEFVKVTNEAGWWWELCLKSENTDTPYWHYNSELEHNHWNAARLLSELLRCRSLGGNLLVNITPRPDGAMMDWFYDLCAQMEAWMQHSAEAVVGVDLDPPLPMLDKTENFTTKKGNVWYAMANEAGTIFIKGVPQPQSVYLLRTGQELSYRYRNGLLQLTIPEALQTPLPDLAKIVFHNPKSTP